MGDTVDDDDEEEDDAADDDDNNRLANLSVPLSPLTYSFFFIIHHI